MFLERLAKSHDTSRAIARPSADNTLPEPNTRPPGSRATKSGSLSAVALGRKNSRTSSVACTGSAYSTRNTPSPDRPSTAPPARAPSAANRSQVTGGSR